jgi:hypothetical protein
MTLKQLIKTAANLITNISLLRTAIGIALFILKILHLLPETNLYITTLYYGVAGLILGTLLNFAVTPKKASSTITPPNSTTDGPWVCSYCNTRNTLEKCVLCGAPKIKS